MEDGIFPVYLMKMPIDDVYITIVVNVGSRDEILPRQAGLAHFLEHALFRGAGRFKNYEVNYYLEKYNGDIDACTLQEMTIFKVVLPISQINKGFAVLSDMLFRPYFSQRNIEIEKNIVLNELKQYQENIEEAITKDIYKIILSEKHPLVNAIIGSEETITNFKVGDLRKFHKFYNLSNMKLLIVGNLSKKKTLYFVKRYFLSRARGIKNVREKIKYPHSLVKNYFIIKPEIKQPKLVLASVLNINEQKDILCLHLFKNMLNHTLFQEIIAKRGLMYNIDIGTRGHEDLTIFYIYGSCFLKHIEEVQDIIFKAIKTTQNDKKLFQKSRSDMGAVFIQMASDPEISSDYLIYNYLSLGKEIPSFLNIIGLINELKFDFFKETIDKYLREDKFYRIVFLKNKPFN